MKQTLSIFFILLLTSCAWVNDDNDDCPDGFWLNLHYTYNILDVEAAPRHVQEVSIYVYDAAGNYIKRLNVNKAELDANSYRVRVDGLTEGDYQFVVWSGVVNNEYAVSGDVETMDKFRVSLSSQTTSYASKLPDLYFGSLSSVHYDMNYATHDVYLMKNTNQLSCIVVPSSPSVTIKPESVTLRIESANATMDAHNNIASDRVMTYEPFAKETVTINDPDFGTLNGTTFSVSTLRLMEGLDCRIILENTETGRQVFNVSFPEYVGMIGAYYTNLGKALSLQEYLDRQDFYTVVFFLSAELDALMQLEVNNWRIRANNHLKL
ncbi:MAG: FimB/Mfa2 family fimbrial subunit [Bacteroidaceae bacterium]|nr:FimB/Mfa2 family fimbrial subunit [Bacteroidaceae bacterium]